MKAKKAGFTLVELLVVIALIALLAMLLIPGIQGMDTRARTVQCQNHLRRIGEAVEGRLAAVGGAEKLDGFGWPGELVKYLGEEGSMVLECPEADGIPEGGLVSGELKELINIVRHENHSGGAVEFVEGPRIVKASKSQYDGVSGEIWRVWDSHEGYIDDGSNVIYWGYEDWTIGSHDYKDVMVKMSMTPDGRTKLECTSQTAGHHCIWDKTTETVVVHYLEYNRHLGGPVNGKTVYLGGGGGTGSNYAMNAHTINIPEAEPGKILAMDYIRVRAGSDDDWRDDNFDTDLDGIPDFARHEGRLNVLFPGGEVRSMSPDEVDPSNVKLETGYWLP